MQRRDADCRNRLVAVPRSPLLFHCSSLFSVQACRRPCPLTPLSGPLEKMTRWSDRPLRMWQRMKQEGCSQPRQSDRTRQGGIGPRGKHPVCILYAYSVCRSFAPHVEGGGFDISWQRCKRLDFGGGWGNCRYFLRCRARSQGLRHGPKANHAVPPASGNGSRGLGFRIRGRPG
jgi:hypothetical protein